MLWWPLLSLILRRWPIYADDTRLRMPVIPGATLGAAALTSGITTLTWITALLQVPGKFPVHDLAQVIVSCLVW